MSEFRWDIGIDGEPCLLNNLTKPDTAYNSIKGMWSYDENGNPKTGAMPFISNSKELTTYNSIRGLWHVDKLVNSGNPYTGFMLIPKPTGAFRNAAKLEKIYIPESVKFIGAETFRFTALKTVKIAADCEYSETSFPEGCEIEFYGGGGTYGQLYDCDGYAVLDCEAARIYVKE